MDNVRSGGRRHDAGRRMLVQQPRRRHQPRPRPRRRARPPRRRAAATAAATAAPSAAPSAALAPAVPAVPTGYTELDKALGADKPFNGKKVSIQTQWIGGEGTNFAASLADFAKATGINDPDRQHRLEPRDGAEDPHRGRRAAGPGHARPADADPGLRRARARSSTSRTFMDAKKLSDGASRRPSAWSPRTARSGASRTRPTSSRPSGTRSRPSRPRATRSPRRGTS